MLEECQAKEIAVLGFEDLFCGCERYVIPMYQRGFAWEYDEIQTLILDIAGNDLDEYFLGSLIVYRRKVEGGCIEYEVVDGQQRLTALYLLKCALSGGRKAFPQGGRLSYECREKAEKALDFAARRGNDPQCGATYGACDRYGGSEGSEKLDDAILRGLKFIDTILCSSDFCENLKMSTDVDKGVVWDKFREKLNKIRLFRIELPQGTDLNLYFERMNTRSEQLEQVDTVKALLMKHLLPAQCKPFAQIWSACSNMDNYVQMGFTRKVRENLFGEEWSVLNEENLGAFLQKDSCDLGHDEKQEVVQKTLKDILHCSSFENDQEEEILAADGRSSRYRSIINFSSFLIHCLKIYLKRECKNIYQKDKNLGVVDYLSRDIDDAKLQGYFETALGLMDDKRRFSLEYVSFLLRLRYLYDRFVIKRELLSSESELKDEGSWCLRSLVKEGEKYSLRLSLDEGVLCKNTKLSEDDWLKNRMLIMMQSCLRVSYTSPRSMHWITILLDCLYSKYSQNSEAVCLSVKNIKLNDLLCCAKEFAIAAVRNDFLCKPFPKDGRELFSMGVETPNVVFHFLDYLLWERDWRRYEKSKDEKFEFRFRNSVEHWYPQHLMKEVHGDGLREDWIDAFGNLCIVSTSVNSKFSNMSPEQKAKNTALINDGSLKLRMMAELTLAEEQSQGTVGNAWKNSCKKHQEEVLDVLARGCRCVRSTNGTYREREREESDLKENFASD